MARDLRQELRRCARWSDLKASPVRHNGFTLLEVIAAIVLMTLLFAALTTLLRGFANQQRSLDKLADSRPETILLENLLRQDLTNARFIRASSDQLILVGNLAQDRLTRLPSGGRAEVTYRIATIADHAWLVRREVQTDVLSSARTFEEPVWRGVGALEFEGLSEWQFEANEIADPVPVGMTAMPVRCRLFIRDSQGRQVLQLNVVHHWESN